MSPSNRKLGLPQTADGGIRHSLLDMANALRGLTRVPFGDGLKQQHAETPDTEIPQVGISDVRSEAAGVAL